MGNYLNPSCRNAVLSRILTKMEEFKTSNSHFQLFFLSSLHLFATFVHTKPPGKSGNVVGWVEHLGRLRQQVLQGLAVILRLPERNLFACLTWTMHDASHMMAA